MRVIREAFMEKERARQADLPKEAAVDDDDDEEDDVDLTYDGATVKNGPLAEEQVKLVSMIQSETMQCKQDAMFEVLGAKTAKFLLKNQTKMQEATEQAEQQKLAAKMNEKMKSIPEEQMLRLQKRQEELTEEMHEKLLKRQESCWIEGLNPEQKAVWDKAQEGMKKAQEEAQEAAKAGDRKTAQMKMQNAQMLGREAQIGVGKMLTPDQQLEMAANMKRIREEYTVQAELAKEAAKEKAKAEEVEAAAAMLDSMGMM